MIYILQNVWAIGAATVAGLLASFFFLKLSHKSVPKGWRASLMA